MKHLEIIIDRDAEAAEHLRLENSAKLIKLKLQPLLGTILENISIRSADQGDIHNLREANYGNANIDVTTYFSRQHNDRRRLGIDANLLELTLTSLPLEMRSSEGVLMHRNMYGYSVEDYGISIASSSLYGGETMPWWDSYTHKRIGTSFTGTHEVGHLIGLVNPSSRQNAPGKHCSNICIMRADRDQHDIMNLDRQLRTRNTPFCNDCMRDINQII